jgi:hypothetical protein
MKYIRIIPHDSLKHLIECYWIVESDDTTTKVEKIIPDGFTELIFHYGDPYRKKVNNEWQSQALNLVCGQISSYFYLENTGTSGNRGVIYFVPIANLYCVRRNILRLYHKNRHRCIKILHMYYCQPLLSKPYLLSLIPYPL